MGGDASRFKALTREQILTLYKAGPEALVSLIEYLQVLLENFEDSAEVLKAEIEELKERLREFAGAVAERQPQQQQTPLQ